MREKSSHSKACPSARSLVGANRPANEAWRNGHSGRREASQQLIAPLQCLLSAAECLHASEQARPPSKGTLYNAAGKVKK